MPLNSPDYHLLIISDLQNLTAGSQRGVEEVDLCHVVRQSLSLLAPRS